MADLCSAADFATLFEQHGAKETGRILGTTERNVYARRVTVERQLGRKLVPPSGISPTSGKVHVHHDSRLVREVHDGVVLVGSDAHYWPGIVTTAHRGFVKFCSVLKPKIVVMNGDVFDGATISRHSPIGWEDRPPVVKEIEACQERLGEIEKAAPKAEKIWPLGNHDARYETRLAQQAPEYAKVNGVHLKDSFALWQPCWSVWINDDVVIKHRLRGGWSATRNNTIFSGKTMVTGHLHSLRVTPFTDYNQTRFGVDSGSLAEPTGPQFVNYLEDAPTDWRSGFVVLTFRAGRLLWPEVAPVFDEKHIEFRGELIEV